MAFTVSSLSELSNAGGKKIWGYSSNDMISVIAASGYFNDMIDLMAVGDVIIASGDVDGTPTVDLLVVTSVTTNVTVTNGT